MSINPKEVATYRTTISLPDEKVLLPNKPKSTSDKPCAKDCPHYADFENALKYWKERVLYAEETLNNYRENVEYTKEAYQRGYSDGLRKAVEIARNIDLLSTMDIEAKVSGDLCKDANAWKTRQQLLIAEAIEREAEEAK